VRRKKHEEIISAARGRRFDLVPEGACLARSKTEEETYF